MQESSAPPSRRPQSTASEAIAHRLAHLSETQGTDAVPELRQALDHADPWLRMHAVEGLSTIVHADARAALALALHDESFGVHMEAARVLAAAGQEGVVAVLLELLHGTPSTSFLHGAAYVLRHARLTPEARAAVAPLLDTLGRPAADLEAPMAAFAALERLAPGAVAPEDRPEPWYHSLPSRRGPRAQSFAPISQDDTTP